MLVGARAGAKTGVRVRAPHITIFVRCACGCGPKSPHTKGLPSYVVHEIIKEFCQNSLFENMTADFILRVQNSLRRNSPEMMHFQAWKKNFLTNIMK